jgi:hypothetical protein
MSIAVVIPWRNPDAAPPAQKIGWRASAAAYTIAYYQTLNIGPVIVVDDGRTGGHFNRHAAYNAGLARATTDVILWNEADTLIPKAQITAAALLAASAPGIVLPFTERHELDAAQTMDVYAGTVDPFTLDGGQFVFPSRKSIGQAGVTSRATVDAIGGRWPTQFEGWGYDDTAAFHCFNTLAGPPRWIDGKGTHLHHPPAFNQPTPDQAAATERNRQQYHYLASLTPEALREYLAT